MDNAAPDIVEFVTDPQLLGLTVSPAQETLLRGIYGLPLPSADHLDLWRQCTGRTTYPAQPFGEVTVIAGARAGKDSRIAAPVVLYEALFGGHDAHLARGERAVIPLVAQDQRATRVAFSYIRDSLVGSSLLNSMVADVLSLEIVLTNRTTILCFPCTLRSLRGWSVPAGVLDELGYFRIEGQADSDAEIQAAIRRGMLAFPSPRLVKISTPYMKSGILYDDFRRGFGQDNPDLLVWRASSQLMNPTILSSRLEEERRKDPGRFSREYEAEFGEDLDAFLPTELVAGAVISGRVALPPVAGAGPYFAAVDPSGGGSDAFTVAIVHTEGPRIVQDVMRGWSGSRSRPLELAAVTAGIADLCRRYGVSYVLGDRYAAEWVRQAFRDARLAYWAAPWTKAEAYRELEPLLVAGQLDLLEHPELLRELRCLERRYHPGGRIAIDHPSGAHDDHANALALAVAHALRSRSRDTEFDENDRPEGSFERFARGGSEQELDDLKRAVLARGVPASTVRHLEETVDAERLGVHLEDLLEEGTLRGRLRRAGLRIDDD